MHYLFYVQEAGKWLDYPCVDAITGTVLASLAVAYECVHFSLTSALFVRYGCLRVYGTSTFKKC